MHTLTFITHLKSLKRLALQLACRADKPLRAAEQCLRNAERGDDASFEFTVAIVPLMLMVCLIAFATVIRSAQMPAWTAASECARAGIATLDPAIGKAQAEDAGNKSLHGNYLSGSVGAAHIVQPDAANWKRGADLTCRVNYNINVSGILMLEGLLPGNVLPMQVDVTLKIEPYKSAWS